MLATWNLGPCLAAGNTCVIKPSELAPLSTIALGEMALEAGLPPGVLNIVTGMGETGSALVAHPEVDAIAFTGGVATGRKVMATAAGVAQAGAAGARGKISQRGLRRR